VSRPAELFRPHRFPAAVDRDEVARDWAARGYGCEWFVDPPGRAWNDFVHDTNELVTVVEGQLELSVLGQVLRVGPGDEVLIPRGAVHSVRNVHSGTTRWLYGYDSER
jgi:mannose-6-phosphate isomerase-like protein (cupin superfamily)